jgi:hypothetical protein
MNEIYEVSFVDKIETLDQIVKIKTHWSGLPCNESNLSSLFR